MAGLKFTLRDITQKDARSMAKQLNNKNIWNNLRDGLPHPYSIEIDVQGDSAQ